MGRFEERRAELEKKGARIAALAVDPIDVSQELSEKLGLGFPILADPAGDTVRAFRVWHAEKKIALPAIFVIDRAGVIRWRKVSTSVTDRPTEDEVLEIVGRVTGK